MFRSQVTRHQRRLTAIRAHAPARRGAVRLRTLLVPAFVALLLALVGAGTVATRTPTPTPTMHHK